MKLKFTIKNIDNTQPKNHVVVLFKTKRFGDLEHDYIKVPTNKKERKFLEENKENKWFQYSRIREIVNKKSKTKMIKTWKDIIIWEYVSKEGEINYE